eukprot:gene19886-7011_t
MADEVTSEQITAQTTPIAADPAAETAQRPSRSLCTCIEGKCNVHKRKKKYSLAERKNHANQRVAALQPNVTDMFQICLAPVRVVGGAVGGVAGGAFGAAHGLYGGATMGAGAGYSLGRGQGMPWQTDPNDDRWQPTRGSVAGMLGGAVGGLAGLVAGVVGGAMVGAWQGAVAGFNLRPL